MQRKLQVLAGDCLTTLLAMRGRTRHWVYATCLNVARQSREGSRSCP